MRVICVLLSCERVLLDYFLQNKPLNNITYFITYENNQIHLSIPNFSPAAGWLWAEKWH